MSRVSAADIYNLTFMNAYVYTLSGAGKKNASAERENSPAYYFPASEIEGGEIFKWRSLN
jgi:hypothetical protein